MIEHITVCGAGTMGHGIAHVLALGGYHVVLHDISAQLLAKAVENIKRNMAAGVKRGKIEPVEMQRALERIAPEEILARSVARADLVVEAVFENLEVKSKLFAELDRACRPETILATNTSALSITELGGATGRPRNFVGLHFFNPVHQMRLVEVVKGRQTAAETVEQALGVIARIKKHAVVVKDSPGFITSRINVMIGNEAFHLLEKGIASAEDIDKAVKLGLNHPMGPFELVDLVGLDVRLSVLQDLHARLGEKFRPSPLLQKYVRQGRLGRKTGRGVFDYGSAQKRTD